jgi:hypothetical protein
MEERLSTLQKWILVQATKGPLKQSRIMTEWFHLPLREQSSTRFGFISIVDRQRIRQQRGPKVYEKAYHSMARSLRRLVKRNLIKIHYHERELTLTEAGTRAVLTLPKSRLVLRPKLPSK